ncbi:hypothetical protein BGZ49_003036, partial [Haplosporangium sp. Z 27]
ECSGLCELCSLVLSASETDHAWRVSQIECLLHSCPWLVSLDLGGPTTASAEVLQQWFDEECDREVDLSCICDDEEENKEEKEVYEEYEEYEESYDNEEY